MTRRRRRDPTEPRTRTLSVEQKQQLAAAMGLTMATPKEVEVPWWSHEEWEAGHRGIAEEWL